MRIGVDLLWVRPGKNGGTESYIRNLLRGFETFKECRSSIALFVSEDNADSFNEFHSSFEIIKCPVNTSSFVKRVIWENLHLISIGKRNGVEAWFFPVYSRPLFVHNVPNITVIHDLQALHYSEYFSRLRNIYFKIAWSSDCKNSSIIGTISGFCKKDIETHYKTAVGKTTFIYNPVLMTSNATPFSELAIKYDISKGEYFYTVSSLAKHKNLITLLKAFKILKDRGEKRKLLITGVKVNAASEVMEYIKYNELDENIVYTGFISDEDRNALYDNCRLFIFPSVFEGFGMPPIEAMIRGIPVLTTKETSLFEVTEGKAHYVNNPYDEKEWADKIVSDYDQVNIAISQHFARCYSVTEIARQYLELFKRCR